jgi:hypothetical protein
MNYLKRCIVNKILSEVKIKQDSINFEGTFHFDSNLKVKIAGKEYSINRINRERPYALNNPFPIEWSMDGGSLVNILFRIKNNEFYFYKKVNGKEHRIRFKK